MSSAIAVNCADCMKLTRSKPKSIHFYIFTRLDSQARALAKALIRKLLRM
ncbi:hypothetical protein SynWH8101_1415 [Synechococcus sp. WH 8101]|nr:hypothetical protein SynWH8101_1415 [Synechococcus sp. WH 8101]